MRFDNLVKRKNLVDARLEVTGTEVIEDILLRLRKRFRVFYNLAEDVAPDGEAFTECEKKRVRGWFGGQRTIFEDNTLVGSRYSQGLKSLSGDGIEDDACAFACGDFLDTGNEVFFLSDDDVIGPELKEFGLLLRSASGGDADRALSLGNLDGGDANAAAGGSDQNEISLGRWPRWIRAPYAVPYCIHMLAPCSKESLSG